MCQAFAVSISVPEIVLSTLLGLSYLIQNSFGMTTVTIHFKCVRTEPQKPKKCTLKLQANN
jgi:hypothetical protein